MESSPWTLDKLFLEQLQPLLAMVSLGYSVSLLVCDAHHCGVQEQIQGLVQKVIESVFKESNSSSNNAQFLKTISFVQICSDGEAQDLLSPQSQALTVMDLPPLGLVVEEATEIIVTDSQAATHFYRCGVSVYQSHFQQSFQKPHNATCGILFTITIETKVAEGQGLQRATVQIFEFLGANEQPYNDLFLPLSWASSAVPLPPEAGFLPWILKRLLENNTLTFLLLCLTLPDASGEEILSAISLIEQVRTVIKRVAPTHWDPSQEAQKRRAAIRELRAQLFLSDQTEQGRIIIQLKKVIKELQVLKSQNWEKKKEKPAGEIKEGDTSLVARISPAQQEALLWQREKALLTLRMETLQREQAEAVKDLEELYQECQHEVFQAFKKHTEEQMDALERQYRNLLKESLGDAIILSAHNQQLRAEKQLSFTETATQTDFQTLTHNDKSHSTT
ncbi:hypothetical protein JD844_017075 [Phrynosoma platyrhinos]|uniref:Uncharacterized protein n=1 Tax=Phrynosoma platyrhinos TaxID=52577 RepID=A0ABQ7SLA3_PHRPL|nr:hypothetical protein JD844_017075 [Phrynosoma platyrhinos]